MKSSPRFKQMLLLCACLWLLGACAKHEAELGSAPSGTPVYAQSLEPTLPETVSRAYHRSCRACHGPDGHGIAAVAPDLRRAKPRSLEQWKQYLTAEHPGAQLSPPTWLNADEIESMSQHLLSRLPPLVGPAAPATPPPAGKRAKR